MRRPVRETAAAAKRFFLLLLAANAVAVASVGHAQSYRITSSTAALPAGSAGVSITGTLKGDISPTPDISLCFYTGYGSLAPIVPNAFTSTSSGDTFTIAVPAPTIQQVPPSAFSNGSFPALLYTVPLSTTSCLGSAQAQPGLSTSITLSYPELTSLSLSSVPQQNPNLTTRIPASLELVGSNFILQSSVIFTPPGTLAAPVMGEAALINANSIVSTIPSGISETGVAVSAEVCNTAVYSYCSTSLPLKMTPLAADTGTLTASLSSANPSQMVGLSATFGAPTPTAAGAPSGLVTFSDAANILASAPLLLDTTAVFVPVPTSSFTTNSLPVQTIVRDINNDGIPDLLFIEPNATTNGAISPVIHVLLGSTPAGQFSSDKHYTGLKYLPCITLLSTAVADFTGDGYPDIAILCSNPNASGPPSKVLYTLFNGNSDGLVGKILSYSPLFGDRIAAADFDKDGKPDIVVIGSVDAAGDTGLQVLLGNGDGSFHAGPVTTGLDTAPSDSFGGFHIGVADLNNDGYPDLAILNAAAPGGLSVDNFIQVFQNDGTGAFTLATTVPTDGTASARFFLDPLGPGQMPALIISSIASSTPGLSVALNQGSANIAFAAPNQTTPVPGMTQAVVGDFNGDRLLDVAINDNATTYILTGDGNGAFSKTYPSLSFTPPAGVTLLAASDENGDGYADLLESVTTAGPAATVTTVYDYLIAGTASASIPAVALAAGVHHLTASFPGTVEIAGASAVTNVTSALIISPITLTASLGSPIRYGTPLTLSGTIADRTATRVVAFYNGTALLGSVSLASSAAFAAASFTAPALSAGTYSFTAVYSGDTSHAAVTSAAIPFVIDAIPPILAWTPNPASIFYGTSLSAAQLDATATGIAAASVPGTFTYSPALGSVLGVGPHALSVSFTPSSPNYLAATAETNITVNQATPVISWPLPADVIVDTVLSTTQLDATAAAPDGTALSGSFVYTPPAGTKLSVAGPETLSLLFTPADTTNYTTATASVSINVGPLGLSSIVPYAALLGDAMKTLTLIGSGFSPTSVVQMIGPFTPATPLPTTYISSTRLTAVLPASAFNTVQVLQLSVYDPARDLPSNALPFTVTAPSTSLGISAPTSISPASQITVVFHLSPYPAPVDASFTLTFKPSGSLPDDPGIVFVTSGLRTSTVTVPAHAAELDLPVTFQSGTISGTLTLTLTLAAGGADVTPASIQPIVIEEPPAVAGISSVSLTQNGNLLTVTTRGYSNTRKVTGAAFHFTPVAGGAISTLALTIDVTSLFSTWYADPASGPYGSLFTYTEVFNLSSDASVVGQVTVTLTNDVGPSQEVNTP